MVLRACRTSHRHASRNASRFTPLFWHGERACRQRCAGGRLRDVVFSSMLIGLIAADYGDDSIDLPNNQLAVELGTQCFVRLVLLRV
jgi:hypothetical protein